MLAANSLRKSFKAGLKNDCSQGHDADVYTLWVISEPLKACANFEVTRGLMSNDLHFPSWILSDDRSSYPSS